MTCRETCGERSDEQASQDRRKRSEYNGSTHRGFDLYLSRLRIPSSLRPLLFGLGLVVWLTFPATTALAQVRPSGSLGRPQSAASQTSIPSEDRSSGNYQPTVVYDQANLLTPAQEAEITRRCLKVIDDASTPLIVVTIPNIGLRSIPGNNIISVADRLFAAFGQTGVSPEVWETGLMILVSRDDRAGTIRLGQSWDERSRDKIAEIVEADFSPLLHAGRFNEAILAGIDRLAPVAQARRDPIDSYWSYFVSIERREWATQWRYIKEMFTAPKLSNPVLQITFIIFVFFIWEWVRPWRKAQPRFREGIGLDLIYTIFSYVVLWALFGTALCTVTAQAFSDFLYHAFGIDNLVAIRLSMLPVWLRYLLLILALEFNSYWIHRLLHHFDWAWEFHKIHHSAKRLDVLNAARLHFGERFVYQFFSYLPMTMIGFEVSDTFFVGLFITIFSNFTHANVSVPLGPLKYIVNSPQLHVWHHAADYHERGNVNFGDALIVWDFVFGTAYIHDETVDTNELRLGFDGVESYPQTFIAQTILPFKNILKGMRRRFRNLVNHP